MEWKIGIGYDSHRFARDRKLVLGGVEIPFDRGLIGHSDADALLHAIIDALLGATHLGDIGKLFPDSDLRYKDISSIELLKIAYKKVEENGYIAGNIDSVIIAECPKLSGYTLQMEKNIANTIHIPVESVSVKAKTNESMGFLGQGEGIAVISTVLVRRHK